MRDREGSPVAGTTLYLVYHRVGAAGPAGLYDVPEALYGRQVGAVARRAVDRQGGTAVLENGHRVLFTFDDGTEDHDRAARVLERAGLRGTFFVVTGRLDRPGHLTRRQVADLAARGHRIASHTVTHRRLPRLAGEDLRRELCESRADLEALAGTPVDWLAPPAGDWSEACLPPCRAAGYRVIRTMRWGAASGLEGVVPAVPILPGYDATRFDRILSGGVPRLAYHAKNMVKALVGDAAYDRLRRLWI